jgi:hypothetical protein
VGEFKEKALHTAVRLGVAEYFTPSNGWINRLECHSTVYKMVSGEGSGLV